jgi:ornithine carbamoyltransferase
MVQAITKTESSDVMQQKLKGKDFLSIGDFSTGEILYLLEEAKELKKLQKSGIPHPYLAGKVLGMLFEKSSTRTRVSFEVGMLQLGGHAIFLSPRDIQLGRGESIHDTAKALSRYLDALMIRTFSHESIQEFADHADVPIVNGLTDPHHPVQVMADLQTIIENKGKLEGLKLCYVGDGNNNVTHSLIEAAAKVGMHISVASPEKYKPSQEIVAKALEDAKFTGSTISIITDPIEAIKDADVVVTDVWTSMGMEAEAQERLQAFQAYQVNEELCSYAKNDYIFMHCLPAHRGEEVTADIIDGPHSVVFDEAENRLHAQKAILKAVLS